MQIEYSLAHRLKDTATVTLILLPAKPCRGWVRCRESCGMDKMLFAPPARRNFRDSHSKRTCLLQWVGIHPLAKSVWEGIVQLLQEFAVVFNTTAS